MSRITERPAHILVLIHGITPDLQPRVDEQYWPFLAGIERAGVSMDHIVRVAWGVPEPDGSAERPDQRLTGAEQQVSARICYDAVERDAAPNNHLLQGLLGRDRGGVPALRGVFTRIREQLVQLGLADAIYYAGPEGETAVRDSIYTQVLSALEPFDGHAVRLHIVGHSLGAIVAHDFLFGLFGPAGRDFPKQTQDDHARDLYHKWRGHADRGQLQLGTLICLASQLPIFVLRKQSLVDLLARGERLDPRAIGVNPGRVTAQFANFYDVDDVLAFAARPLYEDTAAIHDFQVNDGLTALEAHLNYWSDGEVIRNAAHILQQNSA